jgi:hypothetical protein
VGTPRRQQRYALLITKIVMKHNMSMLMLPMSTILPSTRIPPRGSLFLGSIEVSVDTDVHCANSILHIVQVMGKWPVPLEDEGYTYHSVPIDDRADENITPYLDGACAFIEEHLSRGRNVLVHCFEVRVTL